MDIPERLTAAVLGAFWGALAGLLLGEALSLVQPFTGRDDYLVVDRQSVALASSILFAALGLVFKVSAGTWMGQAIAWCFGRLTQKGSPTDALPWWLQLLFYAGLAVLTWWFYQGST